MKNIKYIDLVLENCDVVRLEKSNIPSLFIEDVYTNIFMYNFNDISESKHCKNLIIGIKKPKSIKQISLFDGTTNAYEMITKYSDIVAIDIIYEDGTNEYIYVDFNDYNDNYNINQKNEYNEEYEELEVSINKENAVEFFN